MEEKNKFLKSFFGTITVLVVISCVLVVWYLQKPQQQSSFYSRLLEKNEDFARGEELLKLGSYGESEKYYQLALEKAEGYREESQLKYKIAISKIEDESSLKGFSLLKEIVANQNYSLIIRAYAAQYLGRFGYAYNTPNIRSEIFKNGPYTSFLIGSDYSLALRRLFEYASSLYPLGVSELWVAKWYSNEVLSLSKSQIGNGVSRNTMDEYKSIIAGKLLNAESDLSKIKKDRQTFVYVPEILYRRAEVLGDLYLSGDTSLGNPEEFYKLAISSATNDFDRQAIAKFLYAIFLARMYGDQRSIDIRSLLKDFYSGTRYVSTSTARFLRSREDDTYGDKGNYLLLARIDLEFAKFLRTLGWKN